MLAFILLLPAKKATKNSLYIFFLLQSYEYYSINWYNKNKNK